MYRNFKLEEKIFESYEMEFDIPADTVQANLIVEDGEIEYKRDIFRITKVEKGREATVPIVHVEAQAVWMDLIDVAIPGNLKLTNVTPAAGLTEILSYTDWLIDDDVTTSTELFSLDAQDSNVLALIWEWAKICGMEVQFRSRIRKVVFKEQIGANTGYKFRYGHDLISVKRTSIPPQCTKLYAYGRNDLNISTMTGGYQYIEDFSWYMDRGLTEAEARARHTKSQIYRDDSFLTAESLYAAAVARLSLLSQGELRYEAKVLDWSTILDAPVIDFECGDTVRVQDTPLGIEATARVTRRVIYPNEPQNNVIELGFSTLQIPDQNISSARDNQSKEWELFESHNSTVMRKVRDGTTILHRLPLNHIEGAEWIVTYHCHYVGVGTGTVTFRLFDFETDTDLMPIRTISVADGVEGEVTMSYAVKDLAAGQTTPTIRAYSSGAAVGCDIDLSGTALWVLARGTTQEAITLANSVRYDFTGAVQTFTVPDDVYEIQVEAVGSQGSFAFGYTQTTPSKKGGYGGRVIGTFIVTPGTVYDVYVGGRSSGSVASAACWPNGGDGGNRSADGGGGGGATYLTPTAASIASAIIVAAGGGGQGCWSGVGSPTSGGQGGFYEGEDGESDGYSSTGGGGATQTAGGIAGTPDLGAPSPEAGDADGQGQGGDCHRPGSGVLGADAGGGGGGWHGGGAGGYPLTGGGGGSGYFDSSIGYDLDFTDGYNGGTAPISGYTGAQGYMIISWNEPTPL